MSRTLGTHVRSGHRGRTKRCVNWYQAAHFRSDDWLVVLSGRGGAGAAGIPNQHIILAVSCSVLAGPVFLVRSCSKTETRPWSVINQPIECFQYQSNMGHTKRSQKITRAELDEKLSLSIPSRELLEELAVACAEDPTPGEIFLCE